MNPRNCGYCQACGAGNYDACTTFPVAVQEERDVLIEAVAKVIYAQWSMLQGYTAWVERGNSIRQERARDIARQTLDSVAAMKGDQP